MTKRLSKRVRHGLDKRVRDEQLELECMLVYEKRLCIHYNSITKDNTLGAEELLLRPTYLIRVTLS